MTKRNRGLSPVVSDLGRDDQLKEIPRAQRRAEPKPIEHYVRRARDPRQGMVAAYRSGAYTLAQIARHFDVHYSTVSRAVGRRHAKGEKP